MDKQLERLKTLDEMQWDNSDLEAKFNAYADSSIDSLSITKRMLEAGLYKEAGMNAEDFAAYAYCAEQTLHCLIEKENQMNDLINQGDSEKGATESHE